MNVCPGVRALAFLGGVRMLTALLLPRYRDAVVALSLQTKGEGAKEERRRSKGERLKITGNLSQSLACMSLSIAIEIEYSWHWSSQRYPSLCLFWNCSSANLVKGQIQDHRVFAAIIQLGS